MTTDDTRPLTVAVMGSCITRDAFNTRFNPDYKTFYACPLLHNQGSVISLMSEPVDVEVVPVGDMSDYDRWNVATELSKSFLADLVVLAPDYLVLDFFGDVHFGLVRLEDGRYLTNNHWKLWRTTWYQEQKAAGRLQEVRAADDLEAYVELWTEAFDRLVALVRSRLPETTIVVHRGHFVSHKQDQASGTRTSLNKGRPKRVDIEAVNALWSRLDDVAVARSGASAIDLTHEVWTSYDEHPWGPFFVHYPDAYYHRFLAELHKIHLRAAADAPAVAMLEAIERADDERLQALEADLAAEKDRVARLRTKLAAARDKPAPAPATVLTRVRRRLSRGR